MKQIFLTHFLGNILKEQFDLKKNKLVPEARKLWEDVIKNERTYTKAYYAIAFVIVRLWKAELGDAKLNAEEMKSFPNNLKDRLEKDKPNAALNHSPTTTSLLWKALASAKVEFTKRDVLGETSSNADVVKWLRDVCIALVADSVKMERVLQAAEDGVNSGAWAAYQSEAIRLDLMGE